MAATGIAADEGLVADALGRAASKIAAAHARADTSEWVVVINPDGSWPAAPPVAQVPVVRFNSLSVPGAAAPTPRAGALSDSWDGVDA